MSPRAPHRSSARFCPGHSSAIPRSGACHTARPACGWQSAQGHAASLPWFALRRALVASETIGSLGVITHPLYDGERGFYARWGFQDLPFDPRRAMSVRMVDLRAASGIDISGLEPEAAATGISCRTPISSLPVIAFHLCYTHGWQTVIRLLEAAGWRVVRVTGSHHHFRHTRRSGTVTVAHPVKDIPPGTLRSIERQSSANLRRG
jgi:predicted RNA binding protein YcfA (HicA-like mRNA interferase family)